MDSMDIVRDLSLEEPRGLLRLTLHLDGLKLVEMPADGNCQFHAIADQIRRSTGLTGVHHDNVRAAIVEEIRNHSTRYTLENIVGGYNATHIGENISTIEEYLNVMGCRGEWGDECTLQAAANMLGVTVKVYSSGIGSARILHPEEANGDELANLIVAHVMEMHYDSTEPVQSSGGFENLGALVCEKVLGASVQAMPEQSSTSGKVQETCSGSLECLTKTQNWKKQKIKGYLYSSVPACHVSMNFGRNSGVLFDVCVSNQVKGGLVFTRRREGDGVWRIWPLLEDTKGLSVYAKDARSPWQTERTRDRHALENDQRQILRESQATQTLVPVNMHLRKREGVVMLCCIDLREGGQGGFRAENISLQMSDMDLERVLKESRDIVSQTRESEKGAVVDSVVEDHEHYFELVRKKRESIRAKATEGDDTDDILRTYDENMECIDNHWGLPDDEDKDMSEADERRRGEDAPASFQLSKDSFWRDTWRRALHEGARRFLIQCLVDESLPFERRLVRLMEDNEHAKDQVLDSFKVDDGIKRDITTRHMKGEALELLACYLALARGQCQLRDHRETEQVVHINTRVERVFMSGAPEGSPFRLEDGDLVNLMPQGAPEKLRKFARKMEGHCKRDRFLDVLVVLRDPDNKVHPWHFQAIQCKARRNRRANVSISEYVASLWPLAQEGQKVGCLVNLEWMSNCYVVKQLDPSRGDLSVLETRGYVSRMMFNDMVAEEASLLEAVAKAGRGFESPLKEMLQANDGRPHQLRPFQKEACENDLPKARKEGKKYVTLVAATGSGKSDLMILDGLRAQAEQKHELPLLATCPSLFLVHQLAVRFVSFEQIQMRESNENEGGGKRYYYVLCSDQERVTCPLLRTITNEEVLTVMLQHFWGGTLGYCRFFTTVQGSGRFWNKIITFIRVTRGVDADLMEPVFGTFIRDEVHSQSGPSDKDWSLGLNIPAMWCPSYTATPAQEKISKKMFASTTCEGEQHDSEEDECSMEIENDPSSSNADGNNTTEDFILISDQRMDRDDLQEIKAVEDKYGLRGLQVLCDSLQFISVEEAHRFQNVDMKMVRRIQKSWKQHRGNLVRMREKDFKGKEIVQFDVIPEQHRGLCLCKCSSVHKSWCPFENFEDSERELQNCGIFRAFVDNNGQLEWVHSSMVRVRGSNRRVHDPIVLGWHEASRTLCVRLGSARGLAIHDSSSFGWAQGRNLIGPPVKTYTFGEAFQAEPPILAKPAVAVYTMDPMVLPLQTDDVGITMEQIRACMGYEEVTRENKKSGDVETGIRITNASKIVFKLDFPEEGKRIRATGREYAAVMLLIRLFELQLVMKPIVFCPSGMSCRRTMAIFKLMIRRHLGSDASSEIKCAHVFQSYSRPAGSEEQEPDEVTQPMHVREHILGEFRSHERFALFNTNLLSTGVNLPSCDAAVLVSPTSSARTLLQRWGRSLRVESHRSDKCGYIVLVGDDPKETTEDVERREQALGLEDKDIFSDGGVVDREKMERMHRIVEAAVSNDSSRNLIGDTLDMVAEWQRKGRKLSGGRGGRPIRVRSFFPGCPPGGYEVSLSEVEERALAKMFQVRGKKLMQREWIERYQEHKESMLSEGRWTKHASGDRPDVFRKTNDITIEKQVADRCANLLGKNRFDEECQEFHDFYFKELGYDFHKYWEQNKNKEKFSWPEKYKMHKEVMVGEGRWTSAQNQNGNRPDVFKQNSIIEKRVVLRRYELMRLGSFNAECQEFHDFYFRELGYDFKKDWDQTHNQDSQLTKYMNHKVAMQKAGRWTRAKNKNGNKPNIFMRQSSIAEENEVGLRRTYLLGRRTTFDEDCQEFHDFYYKELGYDFKKDWNQTKAKRDQKEKIPWSEKFQLHKEAMKKVNRWKKAQNDDGNRPGVFSQQSQIPEELFLGRRRNRLLTKKDAFDKDCQEFHDFYYKELGYDFKKDWNQTKAKRDQKEKIPWSEKFQLHKEAMKNANRWKKAQNDDGNRPDIFSQNSQIPEEISVARRRVKLRSKKIFDRACQEFHNFYYKELGYDFKKDWDKNKKEKKRKRGKDTQDASDLMPETAESMDSDNE